MVVEIHLLQLRKAVDHLRKDIPSTRISFSQWLPLSGMTDDHLDRSVS